MLTDEIEPGLFKSKIDTTFALYRPGKSYQCWETTIRTGAPYLLRHLPWYEDPEEFQKKQNIIYKALQAQVPGIKPLPGKINGIQNEDSSHRCHF